LTLSYALVCNYVEFTSNLAQYLEDSNRT
jgi:hypothetical protein